MTISVAFFLSQNGDLIHAEPGYRLLFQEENALYL